MCSHWHKVAVSFLSQIKVLLDLARMLAMTSQMVSSFFSFNPSSTPPMLFTFLKLHSCLSYLETLNMTLFICLFIYFRKQPITFWVALEVLYNPASFCFSAFITYENVINMFSFFSLSVVYFWKITSNMTYFIA